MLVFTQHMVHYNNTLVATAELLSQFLCGCSSIDAAAINKDLGGASVKTSEDFITALDLARYSPSQQVEQHSRMHQLL